MPVLDCRSFACMFALTKEGSVVEAILFAGAGALVEPGFGFSG